MNTLIILVGALGFFCLYNTSSKAKLAATGRCQKWLQLHHPAARTLGTFLLLVSLTFFIILDGWAIGVFNAVLMLMTVACYIVTIAPLFYLKLKHIVFLTSIFFLMEILIF